MELIGIRLWKGVAKQIAGISRCLPARRRVGGERRALGEKRARGRERTALGRSGEEVRLGSPFSRKLGPRGSPLLLVFFWGSESDVRHAATNLEAFLGWN